MNLVYVFQGQTRTAPPLPPSRTNPPAAPSVPPVHRTAPTRPPPPMNSSVVSQPSQPPPPPPPPTFKGAPTLSIPPPPPLPNLADIDGESIMTNDNCPSIPRNGNGPGIARNSNSLSEDNRTMLMDAIRSGTTLKVSMNILPNFNAIQLWKIDRFFIRN